MKANASLVLFCIVFFSFVFISPVFADGGFVVYDPDMFLWKLQEMSQQFCVINHENGIENMLLSVDPGDLQGEKAAWIFPIPAKPDETSINIIRGFPIFLGRDVKDKLSSTVFSMFTVMELSQIYTLPLALIFLGSSQGINVGEEFTIYEHIEKMGVTTELITAENGDTFYSYLKSKDLNLPFDLKSILDEYTGKKYSFVVSWISDIEKFKQESKTETDKFNTMYDRNSNPNVVAVSVSFPTDKTFFPLKLTSVYGDRKIPVLVYVMGHITPELYPEIEKESKVDYFIQRSYDVPEELKGFFNSKTRIDFLEYTKIKIDASSKQFTEDLWINDSVPFDVAIANFINKYDLVWGIIIFVLISCLSSMLSGIVIFRNDRPNKKKFALFGLCNFLTLIGFSIIAYKSKIDNTFTMCKEKIKPQKTSKEIIIISLLAALGLTILIFIPFIGEIYHVKEMVLFVAAFFALTFLIIAPFVWGVYVNRKILKFIILFTIFFSVITLGSLIAILSIV